MIPNPLLIPVGLIVGVMVAAPIGPVNVLCIQRAVERGFWAGVAAGFGAVLGDGLIALSAALGVGAISGAVEQYRIVLQAIGGIALLTFGVLLYRTEPVLEAPAGTGQEPAMLLANAWDIPKTALLTLTNPGAVLGMFAIFGGISTYVEVRSNVEALILVACIMAGSLCWWVVLSHFAGRLRHRLTSQALGRINRIAGLLLLVSGGILVAESAAAALR